MNNDDRVDAGDAETRSTELPAPELETGLEDNDADAEEVEQGFIPSANRTQAQDAEELARKIAEIERKVADGN